MQITLFLDPIGQIDDFIIQFIELPKIIEQFLGCNEQTKNLLKIMQRKISTEEILLRQQLFVDLDNKKAFEIFEKIYQKICLFEQLKKKFAFFKNDEYESIYFFKMAQAFKCIIEEIVNIDQGIFQSKLISNLIACCKQIHHDMLAFFENIDQIADEKIRKSQFACFSFEKRNDDYHNIRIQDDYQTMRDVINNFSTVLNTRIYQKPFFNKLPAKIFQQIFMHENQVYIEIEQFFDIYKGYDLLTVIIDKDSFSFFIEIKNLFNKFKEAGILYSIPRINMDKKIIIDDFYDISLLLQKNAAEIVTNSLVSDGIRTIFIVSGANGGGKTCYLQGICTVCFFFSIGAYVPARNAEIFPFSNLFVLSGLEESTNSGKYTQEKEIIESVLNNLDEQSVLFLNEIMVSTGIQKAYKELLNITYYIINKKAYAFFSTHNYAFIDAIKTENEKLVFMQPILDVSSHLRTFHIKESSVNYCSYSKDILEKYHLLKSDLESIIYND